ncbi:pilus assembly FimT family protein [Rubrobacter tropicus]|uniref:pilus assembly FimT family protein n=1 Tax=Rubrobacter tropicus TaxID=2653851 RepID=UPI00140D82BC|nr:GspH/FimT family pseudopilin [Rubrobacter tropicus]
MGEWGFTLPEVVITIVVLGVLMGIASSTWFSVIESRAVDSAANQLASDLRLAHTRSTNQLANWRVVLSPEKAKESMGPDYYLVKMTSSGGVAAGTAIDRTLPDNTKVVGVPALQDDAAVTTLYSTLGLSGPTRSLEFSPDGSMRNVTVGAGSNEIRVTVDGNPTTRLEFVDVTSRIKVD